MAPFGNRKISLFILSFFGSGLLSKKMPGTFGSAAASILIIPVVYQPNKTALLIASIILFLVGSILSQYFVSNKNHCSNKDPGYIVIDEACGIFFGAFLLSYFNILTLPSLFLNFALFRVFDIYKPFPIKNIEQIAKSHPKFLGFGIMIDDIIAAIFATTLEIIILL